MRQKYIISVIMPVYNTEKYLFESIESIINQTLDFETNIQIILINDASSDQSDIICKQYKKQYPHNFEYILLDENRGASFARNIGLELSIGKYIVFTDSDDKWSRNAFERAANFLEQNSDEVDLVATNIKYFDAVEKPHILNVNNTSDEIIDINKDYDKIRTNVPCFIKNEVAKQYKFNEDQMFKEDTAYINSIILRKQCFGLLASDVMYYYRSRDDGTSIVQGWHNDKRYYLYAPRQLFDTLYKESVRNCGKFVQMMQFVIAYDIVIRFAQNINVLSNEELKQYYEIVYDNIQYVDDELFFKVNYGDIEIKKLIVLFKHNKELINLLVSNNNKDRQIDNLNINLKKRRCNYNILKKMFQLNLQGKRIEDYFIANRYHNIAIYGYADIGVLLHEELKKTKISVTYLIDRNAVKISTDIPIITPEDDFADVDVIVVTAVFYYAEIKEKLQAKTNIPIVSMEEVIGE